MKNKTIAKVVSDGILVLADYTDRIVELYPGLAGEIMFFLLLSTESHSYRLKCV